MALSTLSAEVKIEALRFLRCSDITSVSLVNKSLLKLIDGKGDILPKRAIKIRYVQTIAEDVRKTDLHDDSRDLLREMASKVNKKSVVGGMEIVEISTMNKQFRAFAVAGDDTERQLCADAYSLPAEVENMLHSVLIDDANLVLIDQLQLFSDTHFAPIMADFVAALTARIKVPIRDFLTYRTCNFADELDAQRIISLRDAKRVGHFTYSISIDDVTLMNWCTIFGGTTTHIIRKWACQEKEDGGMGPSTLMECILSAQYHDECRMLVEIHDSVSPFGDYDITPDRLLARIRKVFRYLYSIFNLDESEISLPLQGVWLEFIQVAKGLVPADFWSGVFYGLAPVEVGQPLFVPHDAKEQEGCQRYICDVYELRVPHREKALRVFVANDDPKRGPGLLIHLKRE